MGKKKSGNNIQKTSTNKANSKSKIEYQEQPDVHLTFYTLIAMLAIAVSGAVTALAGAISANPVLSGLEVMYGGTLDPGLIEVLSQALFEGEIGAGIRAIFIASVVVAGVAAVMSLIDMIVAMNPEKKPKTIITWVALVFAVAAFVLYVVGYKRIYDNGAFSDLERGFRINLFTGVGIGHIVNIVFMIANIVGNYIGLNKFKKDGKAY